MAVRKILTCLLLSIAANALPVSNGYNQTCRSTTETEVVILGAGIAGITAAAKKYNLTNTYQDFDSLKTFTDTGAADYTDLLDSFDDAYTITEQDAGYIQTRDLPDRSVRAALNEAGWRSTLDSNASAVEWFNATFYQYSDDNNFVFDSRGFSTIVRGEAATFLRPHDSRLLFNTIVTGISYEDTGVMIQTKNGTCIKASYAICTFSLGVLQRLPSTGGISFNPQLPEWKQNAISTFAIATYTKIFLQFASEDVFWNTSTQFFLYADPYTRGYYPLWQSLDHVDFLPDSGIIFCTVTTPQAYIIEAQSDEETRSQAIAVLRSMFPSSTVPEPIASFYQRWSETPWSYGSYSNWPPYVTLESHQNLRSNVGRVWFAGEHTSAEYYGFLHGALMEGKKAGDRVAECVLGKECAEEVHYGKLTSSTRTDEFNASNGWDVNVSNFNVSGGGTEWQTLKNLVAEKTLAISH
ncbi:uncharacterized protein KY384_001398 [Bacidia gigantensis]|uniref:uncharacterized protein n=1 Tax=Bacidia gigantensis TaxID=2732470 RepID=UPI001D0513BA|nr:uncharacterized protein KY384_001398 [Bacidia gigantensis]KAG8533657.1 hypothetical protein KY384_001398 [Bacidia gigantensis]